MNNDYDVNCSDAQKKGPDSAKHCTKCGRQLVSDSPYNECDNCRRERAEKTKFLLGTGAILMTGLSIFRKVISKK